MPYADGLLSTGERVIHREKQHWFVFVWEARYTILAVIAAVIVAILTNGMTGQGTEATVRDALNIGVIILILVALANLGWTILRYLNQEYVITNRRVMQVSGVLIKTVAFKIAMLDAKHEYEREVTGASDAMPGPPLRTPAPAPATALTAAAV